MSFLPRLRRLETDRGALLVCLIAPWIVALAAFVLAIALTGFSVPTIGTMRSGIAATAYVYLTLGIMWLPSYSAGCIWWWWATRDDETRLMTRLYTLPLVAALFAWFPSLTFLNAPLVFRMKMYPALAVSGIIAGYIWIAIVRMVFYLWRRK
jgi:hypothetical protein